MAPIPISAYEKFEFSAPITGGEAVSHDVYKRGDGPPVVLIQELPGMGQETLRLADKLVEAGFKVIMPHLFGPLGKTATLGNLARVLCLRKEFALFQAKKFAAIDAAFNDEGKTRVAQRVMPGKGHSVLTLDFVDEEGHPTHQALQDVLDYFREQLAT